MKFSATETMFSIRVWIISLCSTVALLGAHVPALAQALPALPQEFLDTTYAPPTGGTTIVVPTDGDFQAALDSAQPGDIIELQSGATFTGNFVLPNKTGQGWIYIQSSAYASLPPPGSRVAASHAQHMPRIVAPLGTDAVGDPSPTGPAIRTDPGAHHYRFVGIEIGTNYVQRKYTDFNLVLLGSALETSELDLPSDIVFDRCYIHGTSTGNLRRGIALNSARSAVIDSYLSDFHEVGADSQAIAGWNGPGPFKLVNNYLEGAGENVIFGGSPPSITNMVPSDIEIRHNHLFKPLAWRDDPLVPDWSIKNLFELKNARRVLVEGNILENNWVDSQNGMGILFTARGEDGRCSWCNVEDVTFRKNILRNSAGGFNIAGTDNSSSIAQASRILIRDNLLYRIDSRFFQLLNVDRIDVPEPPGGIVDLIIDHNTARFSGLFSEPAAVFMGDSQEDDDKHQNPIFRNNLFQRGAFGVAGGGVGEGTVALNTYASAWTFRKNVIIGAPASSYPSDPNNLDQNNQDCSPTGTTCFPATDDEVGFVDWRNDDYRLTSTSPYNDAGTDGNDIGADILAVMAATSGVVSGSPPFSGSPPTGQSPFTGTPFAVPGLFEAEDFDLGGEGVAYHDNVAGNAGGEYRPDEDVDIIVATGNANGYVVNNIETGEWLEYTIDVTSAGPYRIEPRVSSEFADSRFHVEIDGVDVSGSILVPNTGWWGTFQFVPTGDVSLSAGEHILRIHSDQQYFNLDAIQVSPSTSGAEDVVWTDLVNVTATGNSIQKTAGCDGCQDAGAASEQQIVSGDGHVEFTATETNTIRGAGLGNGNTDTTAADIDYTVALWNDGLASVYERGVFIVDLGPYTTGTVVRVAVEGGVVKYYKDGILGYTSQLSPTPLFPLRVDSVLLSPNSTISNAVISTAP
jgi:hypothetical protein